MRKLTQRKRRLVVETPCVIRGSPLVVDVEVSGLQLREKGRRSKIKLSWAQIYNRAAEIAADRLREARRGGNADPKLPADEQEGSGVLLSKFSLHWCSPSGPVSQILT